MKFTPGCSCCAPTPCNNVFVNVTCNGVMPSAGMIVKRWIGGATLGAFVDQATTVLGVRSITRAAAGSGYTNGTFPLAFSGGGGTGAAGTFTVGNGNVLSVSLTSTGSGYTSAPTVSLAAAGGGSGGSVTASIGSVATFPFTVSATYRFSVVDPSGRGRYGETPGGNQSVTCTANSFLNFAAPVDINWVYIVGSPYPMSKTLYLTTGDGTVTVNYGANTSVAIWQGYIDHTEAGALADNNPGGTCIQQTVTGPVLYSLQTTPTPSLPFSSFNRWGYCGVCVDNVDPNPSVYFTNGAVTGSPPAMSVFNSSGPDYGGCALPRGFGGNQTMTWTTPTDLMGSWSGTATFAGIGGGSFPVTE